MRTKLLRYSFGCLLAALLCLSAALGQTVAGSITGLVTDPSDAVVVGANVTAENSATSVKTTVRTNASGVYTIRFLPIGTYTVTIEATGFTTQKIPPFALEINRLVVTNAPAFSPGPPLTDAVARPEAQQAPSLDPRAMDE